MCLKDLKNLLTESINVVVEAKRTYVMNKKHTLKKQLAEILNRNIDDSNLVDSILNCLLYFEITKCTNKMQKDRLLESYSSFFDAIHNIPL